MGCASSPGTSRWSRPALLGLLLLALALVADRAGAREFTVHRLDSGVPGPTLLVIGGIQGDEPGGFNAAALLVTRYAIDRGSVWVVPNLNFESILRRSRGVHGDMNRKFADLPPSDPQYKMVKRVKELIRDEEVDAVLNLHDGSGFYRRHHIDELQSPWRWGQSVIVDQAQMEAPRFGDLETVASSVAARANMQIADHEHFYSVKNTETGEGNAEMAKTLTWYAVRHGKPAFGVEASKQFGTARRTDFHLKVLEGFMDHMGIDYQRDFPRTLAGVETAMEDDMELAFYDRRIRLDLANARSRLGYVPLKEGSELEFAADSPLVAVLQDDGSYVVRHGNQELTRLNPQYFEYHDGLDQVALEVDGRPVEAEFGSVVPVSEDFRVEPREGYRVNVIGYVSDQEDQAGERIRRDDILSRYSLDRSGRTFRVEVYREDAFVGMALVRFGGDDPQGPRLLRQARHGGDRDDGSGR
ncbi:MAG: M99 family carboxypeptidase catalytic domain-containing protein [Pseudomonadota bacterium]